MPKSKEEINRLKEKIQELEDGWKRTQADFVNYKNRVMAEKNEWARVMKFDALLDILPVYDNLERAFTHLSSDAKQTAENDKDLQNWLLGIEYVKKQFCEKLQLLGLEKINTDGIQFDPNSMEAVGTDDGQEGIVLHEVESGWKADDKIVRPAKVIVGK